MYNIIMYLINNEYDQYLVDSRIIDWVPIKEYNIKA